VDVCACKREKRPGRGMIYCLVSIRKERMGG
jgi:hypothetical protein